MERAISKAVIRRLPRYYRYLGELVKNGVERISSNELSVIMEVTASQIRQDLNNFGGFGQQGYGYNVQNLYDEIGRILGIDHEHDMILLGAGNFGKTLAKYFTDEDRSGFRLVGIFDADPEKEGQVIGGLPVRMLDEVPSFLRENPAKIGILTVPKDNVVSAANLLVSCGIKALWNYARVDLKLPEDVAVENVHLLDSLMTLCYDLEDRERHAAL